MASPRAASSSTEPSESPVKTRPRFSLHASRDSIWRSESPAAERTPSSGSANVSPFFSRQAEQQRPHRRLGRLAERAHRGEAHLDVRRGEVGAGTREHELALHGRIGLRRERLLEQRQAAPRRRRFRRAPLAALRRTPRSAANSRRPAIAAATSRRMRLLMEMLSRLAGAGLTSAPVAASTHALAVDDQHAAVGDLQLVVGQRGEDRQRLVGGRLGDCGDRLDLRVRLLGGEPGHHRGIEGRERRRGEQGDGSEESGEAKAHGGRIREGRGPARPRGAGGRRLRTAAATRERVSSPACPSSCRCPR